MAGVETKRQRRKGRSLCVGRAKGSRREFNDGHTNHGRGMEEEQPTMWKEVVHTYIRTKTAERAALSMEIGRAHV